MKCIVAMALICGAVSIAQAADPIAIPYVRDPTPVVDGSLLEWEGRGVLREINTPAQATFNRDAWKGVDDLSGWVRFGHNEQVLFIACHVVDSHFVQDQSGVEVWRADHVMLTVDFIRGGDIDDVMQLGLSPGSLKGPDDAGPDTQPELVLWRPQGWPVAGAQVAARRTAEGYDIEAAIPWSVFKIEPVPFQTFGLQLGFSDCDTSPSTQQKAVSISTAPWTPRDPKRLTLAILADNAGQYPASILAEATTLAESLTLAHNETREFVVDVDEIPEGMVPTLTFKGRVDHKSAAGCAGPLRLTINGEGIAPANIANRPAQMTTLGGSILSAWYAAGVRMWFGPSYDAIEASGYKPLDVVSYDYTLRLDGMFKPGRNTITLQNTDKRPELVVVMDDLSFSWSPPSRFVPPKELAPAPTGDIPTFVPQATTKVDYEITSLPGGAIKVAWAGREQTFTSQFSILGGGWAELGEQQADGWQEAGLNVALGFGERPVFAGRTDHLQLVRTYIAEDECIRVRDRLMNLSPTEDRPIILRHGTAPGAYDKLYLAGRPMPTNSGAAGVPSNPSVVVLTDDTGFAMMPRDDVFRLHGRVSCNENAAQISDDTLVIRPGVTYVHEWLIFPLAGGDYWRFVNAARRHFDTNFAIEGSFCFQDEDMYPWQVVNKIEWSGARYLSLGPQSYWKGMFAHGPFMATLDQSKVIAMQRTIEAVSPQTLRLQYFNCFNRSLAKQKEDPDGWADDQVRLPNGDQVADGTTLSFYFPTLDNEWGREMDKLAEWMLTTIGADGLYWDCYDYWNVTHYGDPWDGWTADIDPRSHRITRKKSSLTLISWPWREKWTARLLSEGRPLVANGNPTQTSEYQYRFPRFVETADISSLSKTHLFTPIALGDHVTERNEVDAYRWMLNALDWGGLYYWYGQKPSRPSLTARMFPFTPVELHSGYLIGEERIITKVSGLFGWGDASDFNVYVFDRTGRETDQYMPKHTLIDGRSYAEVRIPEGYAVVIERAVP